MKITGRSGMTTFLSLTVFLSAQSLSAKPSHQPILNTSQSNFYITTPQTGVSTPVGAAPIHSANMASAAPASKSSSYNTYLTNTPQPFAVPSAATASNPARTTNQQSSRRPAAAASYTANSRAQIVSTSANYAATNTANYNTYTAPSPQVNASAAHVQSQGLMGKLFHKPAASASSSARITNVSNSNAALASAAASSAKYNKSKLDGSSQSGQASWYGSDFHGGKTANGERYNMESMTAAHKSLPFGTMVCVRNERNGRECVVRINNRGPFIKGRILDVSKAAARELGMISSGVAKVSMRVVGRSSS